MIDEPVVTFVAVGGRVAVTGRDSNGYLREVVTADEAALAVLSDALTAARVDDFDGRFGASGLVARPNSGVRSVVASWLEEHDAAFAPEPVR